MREPVADREVTHRFPLLLQDMPVYICSEASFREEDATGEKGSGRRARWAGSLGAR